MNWLAIVRPICWVKGHLFYQDYSNYVIVRDLLDFLYNMRAIDERPDRGSEKLHKFDDIVCGTCGKIVSSKQRYTGSVT